MYCGFYDFCLALLTIQRGNQYVKGKKYLNSIICSELCLVIKLLGSNSFYLMGMKHDHMVNVKLVITVNPGVWGHCIFIPRSNSMTV